MDATRVLGGAFAVLTALEMIGYGILQQGAQDVELVATAAERPFATVVIGMTWIFGLWVALVLLIVFLIAWVGESMQANEAGDKAPVLTIQGSNPRTAAIPSYRHDLSKAS